ncbi:integrase domain-containing protein [Vibrio rotiferianus]|uniref:integrase domain-containing protein n=1 Tax=Vibrio rotiferianus TaxID=190895 RepID=UPI00069486F1|nr:integrase domain-containing protein [Vibrio rotiferianus]
MARKNGKDLKKQATAVIKSRISTREFPKQNVGNYKPMQSIRSINDTSDALANIAKNMGVKRIKHITPEMAKTYLEQKRDSYASQKSLDRDRKALSIALQIKLDRSEYTAIKETVLKTRSYTSPQVTEICRHMSERNSFSVRLAHSAGLRAHELLTITRASENSPSNTRSWSEDRFSGREGVTYLVTGKGGLRREVQISRELSVELESKRLSSPKVVTDRKVHYLQYYDIGGGKNLSSAFSRASKKALNFSHGLHGVRHSYAQERMDEVKTHFKVGHDQARDIVAQELGHFRGYITEVYLR